MWRQIEARLPIHPVKWCRAAICHCSVRENLVRRRTKIEIGIARAHFICGPISSRFFVPSLSTTLGAQCNAHMSILKARTAYEGGGREGKGEIEGTDKNKIERPIACRNRRKSQTNNGLSLSLSPLPLCVSRDLGLSLFAVTPGSGVSSVSGF